MSNHLRVFLELRRQRWYVVKDVPPALRKLAGKKRLVKSTETGDLSVANARKPAILAAFQQQIEELRKRRTGRFDPWIEKARLLGEYAREHPEGAETTRAPSGQELIGTREAASMLADDAPEELQGQVYRIANGERSLSDSLTDFLVERRLGKKRLSPKTLVDYRRSCERFINAVTVSYPKEVAPAHAEQYSATLERKYSHFHTISRELTALSSFWRWMIRQKCATANPWPTLRPERDSDGEDAESWGIFTDPELLTILNAFPEGGVLGDFTRIGALTGMRREEIARHCRVVEWEGITCFQVKKGKTKNAVRMVPVHSALASIVAVRRKHEEGLFGDVAVKHVGDALGKRFAYKLRKKLGITDTAKVFHSLRKWHMTAMERAGIDPWTMEQIQGRKRQTLGLRIYTKGKTTEALQEYIERVHLPAAPATNP